MLILDRLNLRSFELGARLQWKRIWKKSNSSLNSNYKITIEKALGKSTRHVGVGKGSFTLQRNSCLIVFRSFCFLWQLLLWVRISRNKLFLRIISTARALSLHCKGGVKWVCVKCILHSPAARCTACCRPLQCTITPPPQPWTSKVAKAASQPAQSHFQAEIGFFYCCHLFKNIFGIKMHWHMIKLLVRMTQMCFDRSTF